MESPFFEYLNDAQTLTALPQKKLNMRVKMKLNIHYYTKNEAYKRVLKNQLNKAEESAVIFTLVNGSS
jgi:hypothetical protein